MRPEPRPGPCWGPGCRESRREGSCPRRSVSVPEKDNWPPHDSHVSMWLRVWLKAEAPRRPCGWAPHCRPPRHPGPAAQVSCRAPWGLRLQALAPKAAPCPEGSPRPAGAQRRACPSAVSPPSPRPRPRPDPAASPFGEHDAPDVTNATSVCPFGWRPRLQGLKPPATELTKLQGHRTLRGSRGGFGAPGRRREQPGCGGCFKRSGASRKGSAPLTGLPGPSVSGCFAPPAPTSDGRPPLPAPAPPGV